MQTYVTAFITQASRKTCRSLLRQAPIILTAITKPILGDTKLDDIRKRINRLFGKRYRE